mgnify:CR=1 FL=1
MKVLVTGGAGYIGSVTAKALEKAGHTPIILDSLISGPRAFVRDRIFYEGDIADRALLGDQVPTAGTQPVRADGSRPASAGARFRRCRGIRRW